MISSTFYNIEYKEYKSMICNNHEVLCLALSLFISLSSIAGIHLDLLCIVVHNFFDLTSNTV